ncbi:hypothetical protein B2J88_06975, partial [Rhodococcus sp. SRB_17]|nr:hypothetical protein [Rhodococcus sp. SRB_17]
MWFAQHLLGDVPVNIAQYVEVLGPLDVQLLSDSGYRAAAELGSGLLRIIEIDNEPFQMIDTELRAEITSMDFSDHPDPVAAATEWMQADFRAPVDMVTGWLTRSVTLRLADNHYFWYTRMHHIALDGFGAMTFMNLIAQRYTEAIEGTPEAPVNFSDLREIREYEDKYRGSRRFETDRAYWADVTRDFPHPISLAGRTAPVGSQSVVVSDQMSVDTEDAVLAMVARTPGASFATVAIAAVAAFLSRLTGEDDIVLSLPVSARTTARLRRSGGMMSNVVPIRLSTAGHKDTGTLVREVQLGLTGALRHQQFRHEDIRREADVGTTQRGFFGPAINIMMFHSEIRLGSTLGRLNVLSTGPVDDLSINIYPAVVGSHAHIDFEANANLYTRDDLAAHHARFSEFLRDFARSGDEEQISSIDVLHEDEYRDLVPAMGEPATSPRLFVDFLLDGVVANPDGIAVWSAGHTLTYRELDQRSNQFARVLIDAGAGPEALIALALDRSVDALVALWAVAKTGAGFVPVDPKLPQARIIHLLSDSGVRFGITAVRTMDSLPSLVSWMVLDSDQTRVDIDSRSVSAISAAEQLSAPSIDNVAYVIYTSGSTGLPKGVVVTHRGLSQFAASARPELGITASSRVLRFSSASFDASVFEMLQAFSAGAAMIVTPPDVYGGDELVDLLREQRVTHILSAPTLLNTVDPEGLPDLEAVVVGGDVCTPDLVERFGPACRFTNSYGPTETTIVITTSEPITPGVPATIGRPIQGASAVVLDRKLRPVPVGVVAELYLSGPGLARAYHGRPDTTAERFVANPFGEPGSRMYRSGDEVRWTPDHQLEFIGRSDFQVKIRGFRIELGEIDAVLAAQDSVDFAVTVAHEATADNTVLVSYLRPAPGFDFDSAAILAAVAEQLPSHMVPTTVIRLEHVPLTPTGKLDRRALPAPVFTAPEDEYRAPTTEAEEIVAGVFSELLGIDRISVDVSFFALGGNSLIATKVIARVNTALDAHLGVRDIFDEPTVSGIAAKVVARSGITTSRPALIARVRPEHIPLSAAQQRMWFVNQFDTSSAAYNVPMIVRLTGELDVPALSAALLAVIERHESLRTMFPDTPSGPHQVVLAAGEVHTDLAPVVVSDEADLRAQLGEFSLAGFDVTAAVPLRARLFEIHSGDYALAIVVHHIATDGFSLTPLVRDVMVAYSAHLAGHVPTWSPLNIQYVDYTLWQRELLGDEQDPESLASEQLGYWSSTLTGLPELLELPTDRPRPNQQSRGGARVEFHIDADVHDAVVNTAHQHNSSVFMVMHAALAVLLARLSGTSDIVVGTPVAGRGEPELDDLIGVFVNTLVLRTQVDLQTPFSDLLEQVREIDLGAFGNADVPFEQLVEVLAPARSTAHAPLFQVLLEFQNNAAVRLELPHMTVEPVRFDLEMSKFDLQLTVAEVHDADGTPAGMTAGFVFATDLFDINTVEVFAQRFQRILATVAADPSEAVGDIGLLEVAERELMTIGWNDTSHEFSAVTLSDLVSDQMARTPDGVAVTFDGESLTYAEFDSRVSRLARELISQGVGPDSTVGVLLARSTELLVAVHAVLRAGGAYVPLDPEYPSERIVSIVKSARPLLVLTSSEQGTLATEFDGVPCLDLAVVDLSGWESAPVTDVDRRARLVPANTAYVIFTSGSTGVPKGVAVPHSAIVNQFLWRQEVYGLDQSDVILVKTPATFDVSVWEMFWSFMSGGRAVIAEPDGHRDPHYLASLIEREGVTVTHFVPAMLELFLLQDVAERCDSLRLVFSGGEALKASTAVHFRGVMNARLQNLYGPAETAVDVTYHAVTEEDSVLVPMGVPVSNTQVYILDPRLNPVPVGLVGELYVAGDQLARGYVGRPDLTADRFVANPFGADEDSSRLYRTGDLVRWTERGELVYVGRVDFQVKLRGQRIELGEIEAALLGCPAVTQSVALVRNDSAAGDYLAAYVVLEAGSEVDERSLLESVGKALPRYMVPSALSILEALPLNANGKLDRKMLPKPTFERLADYVAPRTDTEAMVAKIFAEVLGAGDDATGRFGVYDSFFDLGGNSLVATRVLARINEALNVHVSVRELFETPTIGGLAALVDGAELTASGRPALTASLRPEHIPLSSAQSRMWFLNRFDPTSGAYNVIAALKLSGSLNGAALAESVSDITTRHEALRTIYPESPQGPHQVILPAAEVVRDLTPQHVDAAELEARIREAVATGFDVTSQVPAALTLLSVAEDEHVLLMVVHHISVDGWSMRVLARDLVQAYAARIEGNSPGWHALEAQYADYALWQRQVLGSEEDPASLISQQIGYWKGNLDGLPDQLDLPADRPRPVVASNHGADFAFTIDSKTHDGLNRLARAHNASLFMVVHAAVTVLLARLSATSDIAVGTPVAGRGDASLDSLVGMFVNTLVLRTQVDGAAPFSEFLEQVKQTDLHAFEYADVPFERLVEVLNPARSQARHPLFQVALSFENLERAELELSGLTVSTMEFDTASSKFDLQLTLSEGLSENGVSAGMPATFTYTTDLFDESTVAEFATALTQILRSVVADASVAVGDLEWMSPGDIAELTTVVSDDAMPSALLVDILTAGCAIDLDAVAVRSEGRSVTYRELDEASSRLARVLIARGAGPENIVALAFPRSYEMVVAVWAAAKSGAAYVPVDPNYPADRIAHMLSDSRAVLGVTGSAFAGQLPVGASWLVLDAPATQVLLEAQSAAPVTDEHRVSVLRAEHAAYVIYTSGSTGKPKGVTVTHTGLRGLLESATARYRVSAESRVLQNCSPSFDPSVLEWMVAFHAGATSVIVPPSIIGGHELTELLRVERVTHGLITPAVLGTLDPAVLVDLEMVSIGGDVTAPDLVARWAPGRTYFNAYGPTETTIISTYAHLTAGSPVTIGSPIEGVTALVLDERLHPVPIGTRGELYFAGAVLARGYHDRPSLTSDRFVANPYSADGSRMYRTGDVVRWIGGTSSAAGELEYLGRSDFQVKVRGFRIELGEIDAVLSGHPDVEFAVTVGRELPSGATTLVSYVVVVAGFEGDLDVEALTKHVGASLPAYMVPSAIMVLDEVPLTPVGKLDRNALPDPVFEVREFRAPVTPVEEIVAGVFAEILGAPRVGLDDDFFDLGGNSLIATQVVSRLAAALETRIPVRDLFEAPTVESLASRIESQVGVGGRAALTAQVRPERVPLSLAQQRMWFLNRFDSVSSVNNIPAAIQLSGALDHSALQDAITDVIERHEILRTIYPEHDGTGYQCVLPANDVAVAQGIDLSVETIAVSDTVDRITGIVSQGFDVTSSVPLRVRLLQVADDGWVLVFVVHHIAADGFSVAPLIRDLMIAYSARTHGEAPGWAPLAVQYSDFALWQHQILGVADDTESVMSQQINFWTSALAGLPEQLDLPTDRVRPAVASNRGATYSFTLDADLHSALNVLARSRNASLFMVLHSALAVLLARLSATSDIAIGTPIAGRGEQALDDLVGMFVNTLVLRTDLDPAWTFAELLDAAREVDLQAFGHADVPFERLVEVLNPVRSQARNPLFQVALSFQNLAKTSLELPGMSVNIVEIDSGTAKFDLSLTLVESIGEAGELGGLAAQFSYATDLFDEATVRGFADRLVRILEAAAVD